MLETTLSAAAADVASGHLEPPATIVVGGVVRLRVALERLGGSG